ncbi:MAG: hypothetical protein BAA04_11320 [Firmicutes bacterium ZCTH02-B6]|nr:MAG: hypothetical protein BAA04_11320 [Firmicutes bacterium ZCTH02-B6]
MTAVTQSMWLDMLIIFGLQVVYVSLMTLRWLFVMKGNRYPAAALSVAEVIIWVYALGLVVSQLGDWPRLLAYALGYATGQLTGSRLEELLAYGYTAVQVVAKSPTELPRILREQGFGVTTWPASGRDGHREVILVVARRRWTGELFRLIETHEPGAFTVLMEPRSFRGGFLARRVQPVPGAAPPIAPGPTA